MGNHSRFETTTTQLQNNLAPRRTSRTRQDSFRLQKMIDDLRRFASSLDTEITLEEERAHVHDQSHYTYPITAKTMRARKDNLTLTIAALETQLQAANRIVAESAAGETYNAA